MYHIRDCDRSGISIAPVTRDAAQKKRSSIGRSERPQPFRRWLVGSSLKLLNTSLLCSRASSLS
ncbi:hypothetical protein RchiOBHm_Chr5g0018271 [Rosa chinensis]|uniref:Uncharacterized protein n=1 Tax=Rosa chinensis TaxID=74649 RepID=A0A2P6Q6R1_ROSCH|nr:hypothetical protein RchiOBHm_Chr5g0018271 [Rosa chinensis]